MFNILWKIVLHAPSGSGQRNDLKLSGQENIKRGARFLNSS
jgi:hypothetical protein